MPKQAYRDHVFKPRSLEIIDQANEIIEEYTEQGFDLTLRQLYYQFVSRDLIANTQQEYSKLGAIISDARLAGLIDWEAIVDRTRELRKTDTWESPRDILMAAAESYCMDPWDTQSVRVEVWIEKDALIGVIEGVCKKKWRVPHFSCRGYTSQSEMWAAAQRICNEYSHHAKVVILHLGDHDPSGLDMTRDITDRLEMFCLGNGFDPPEVKRIALNWDQIQRYKPPPNPAKVTDSRARAYIQQFGHESWELDAMEPRVLAALVETEIRKLLDAKNWLHVLQVEKEHRAELTKLASETEWST